LRCDPLRLSCVEGRLVCGQLSAFPAVTAILKYAGV
jgi:hypothetical protein